MQDKTGDFVGKKLYEISYALCRVAARIHPGVGARLEESAFQIVELSNSLNIQDVRRIFDITKNQIRLGADSGIIHKGNSEVILGEIMKLESFLRSGKEIEIGNRAEIEGIFSNQDFPEKKKSKSDDGNPIKLESGNSRVQTEGYVEEANEDRQSVEIRQRSVLDFIEKSGNCRMRDLVEQFPNSSERTLRNDVQFLSARGLIERLGEGGPGTYYRHKSPISQSSTRD
ncbi:MAG: DeoR family transcriptional regulator [Candidatus Liptonbacteria bacterium]|nr:DeoR family transcriptional regulator [Candidatus Liptonbacteria bacterium]